MTTVVNSPGNGDSSATGMILGILIALVIIVLFFVYGLPAIRGNKASTENPGINVDVNLPAPAGNDANNAPSGGTNGGAAPAY